MAQLEDAAMIEGLAAVIILLIIIGFVLLTIVGFAMAVFAPREEKQDARLTEIRRAGERMDRAREEVTQQAIERIRREVENRSR